MEAINTIANKIIKEVNEDLEVVSNANPELQAVADSIKINLAAGLANMRYLIQDKVRLREITIENNRKFHLVDGEVIFLVLGIAKKANTTRAEGKFSVVWGQNHPLNICRPNILPRKTKDNSCLLGTLAGLTQLAQLGFRRAKIMTNTVKLKTTIQNIELTHAANYLDDNREQIPDKDILMMIRNKLSETNLQLSLFVFQPPNPLDNLYRVLLETGRSMMGGL